MCIRDRPADQRVGVHREHDLHVGDTSHHGAQRLADGQEGFCLLYTSDAADERSSVDLGCRRFLKKKKKDQTSLDDVHTHPTLVYDSVS